MSRRLICGQQQPPRCPGFGRRLRGISLHGESRCVPEPHAAAWRGHGTGTVLGAPQTPGDLLSYHRAPAQGHAVTQAGGRAVPPAPPWAVAALEAFPLHQVERSDTQTWHSSMACAF